MTAGNSGFVVGDPLSLAADALPAVLAVKGSLRPANSAALDRSGRLGRKHLIQGKGDMRSVVLRAILRWIVPWRSPGYFQAGGSSGRPSGHAELPPPHPLRSRKSLTAFPLLAIRRPVAAYLTSYRSGLDSQIMPRSCQECKSLFRGPGPDTVTIPGLGALYALIGRNLFWSPNCPSSLTKESRDFCGIIRWTLAKTTLIADL